MATTEERDIPELPDLILEIGSTITSLDERIRNAPPGSIDGAMVMAEIVNTVLPLLKDGLDSTLISLVEIRDIAEPVKLTGGEADEVTTLLAALRESQKDNPQLVERIDGALELLAADDEDDEAEGDEEEEN